jgi:hypothetical protein
VSTTTTAAERVARLRADADAAGEPLDHLSDLDVLNQYAELRERERIDLNDRYMGLLVTLRKHDDRVRAATTAAIRERVDQIAADAVTRLYGDITRILRAVEALPGTANPERVARLKDIAANTRHLLSLRKDSAEAKAWRRDDNAALVHDARGVVGILESREGIAASEVIRLVKEALAPNGNLLDLFDVADTGTPKQDPDRQPTAFASGEHWHDRRSYFAYEPPHTSARIVAYDLGDAWHLDLWSPTGTLLAYGTTTAERVATLAPALIAHVDGWSRDRDGRPWQRFQAVAQHEGGHE